MDTYPPVEVLEEYPLILTDGRILEIYHGLGVTLPSRRKKIPEPILEMHPDTARDMSIKEGDWVWIETHQNTPRFKRKVKFAPHLHTRVVWGNTHFFYPEKTNMDERIESNINLTHTLEGPYDPIDGATQIRGVPCRITAA